MNNPIGLTVRMDVFEMALAMLCKTTLPTPELLSQFRAALESKIPSNPHDQYSGDYGHAIRAFVARL